MSKQDILQRVQNFINNPEQYVKIEIRLNESGKVVCTITETERLEG